MIETRPICKKNMAVNPKSANDDMVRLADIRRD